MTFSQDILPKADCFSSSSSVCPLLLSAPPFSLNWPILLPLSPEG